MAEGTTFRSGFVTLVGRPNTGKSTLLNSLLERKLAIVTPHPQTTRTHLLGVLNVAAQGENRVGDPGAPGPVERQAGRVAQPREAPRQSMGERPGGQIVLVDTPGVHRGRGHLSRAMAQSVRAGLEGRDLALYLADVTRPFGAEDQLALDLLGSPDTPGIPPAFLVLNKIDRLARRDELLPIIEAWRQRRAFAEVIPISALRRQNLDTLVHQILACLPEGPEYFGPGQLTDQPEHFLIAEVIRERAMLATQAEVPHTLAVRIESDESKRQKATPLRVLKAAIYCERPGQKAILVGRGGEMIRRIGTEARQQLEETLGTRVFLELHVLVRDEWRQDPRFVAGLDFRRNL